MRRPLHSASSVLFGIMLVLRGIVLAPDAPVLARDDPEAAGEPRATMDVDLEAGEFAWWPQIRETVGDTDPMMDYPAGVMIALDDPLLLFLDGEGSMQRLAASDAFAMPQTVSARTVAMMAEAPVRYLTVELVDPVSILEGAIDARGDLLPFGVEAGAHTMSVWHVDTAMGVPEQVADHLGSLALPMLVFVRAGAVEVPAVDVSGTPRQVMAGEWSVVLPGMQIAAVSDGEAPELVFVTLDPPEKSTAVPPPVGSAPQAPASSQGNPGAQPSGPVIVAPPTATVVPPPTVTPVPSAIPPTVPGEGSGGTGTSGPGTGSNSGNGGSGNSGGTGQASDIPITNPENPALIVTPADEGGGGDITIVDQPVLIVTPPEENNDIIITDNVPLPNPEPPAGGSGGLNTSPILTTGIQPSTSVADVADDDADGLTNAKERELGTKPNKSDSDGDGLADGEEVNIHRTNPLLTDTDRDGLSDGWELSVGLLALDEDGDDDGLLDGEETTTNPRLADSDGDGLLDGDEMLVHGTRPDVYDMDQDCYSDGEEIAQGTSPFRGDGYLHCTE